MLRPTLIVLVVAAPVGGCAVEPVDTVPQAVAKSDPCEQEWRCGGNSPLIDLQLGFHDFSLDPAKPNAAKLGLHGSENGDIWIDGIRYSLGLEDARLVARSSRKTLRSTELLGGIIPIDSDGRSPAYYIRIANVREMTYPFGPPDPLDAYVLEWADAGTQTYVNLCANPPHYLLNRSVEHAFIELLGLDPSEAVVFGLDVIDTTAKRMQQTGDDRRFNIGCAGHTLAKLHLTRNTLGSTPYQDPWLHAERRQATMKLLVGDYCGTGRSFTLPGQPLQWKGDVDDARDSYFTGVAIAGIEARWNAEGATCISEPRMATSTLVDAPKYFPDIWAQLKEECDRPACSPEDPDELDGHTRVSGIVGP
jgi:hypothetical protein